MLNFTYYVVRTGPDRFDLRQYRYAAQRLAGKEHPNDVIAVGFNGKGMRELIAEWFINTNDAALKYDE